MSALKTSPQTYALRKDFEKLIAQLQEIGEGLNKYSFSNLEELDKEVVALEEKKAAVKVELDETLRRARLDNELAIRKDEEKFLNDLAKKYSFVLVTAEENLQRIKAAEVNQKEIEDAVKKAEQTAAIKYSYEKRSLESDHKIAVAEITAENKALKETVANLKVTVTELREQLTEANETIRQVSANSSKAVNQSFGK